MIATYVIVALVTWLGGFVGGFAVGTHVQVKRTLRALADGGPDV